MPKMQPFCRHCGKPIAKAPKTVYFADTIEGKPNVAWCRYVCLSREARPRTLAECQRFSNLEIISVRKGVDGAISHFNEWDGDSYKDDFFCSGSCAQAHARWMIQIADRAPPRTYRLPVTSVYADAVEKAAKAVNESARKAD